MIEGNLRDAARMPLASRPSIEDTMTRSEAEKIHQARVFGINGME